MARFATAILAAEALQLGGLIAHPTSGLWGIAADPLHAGAVASLDALKARQPGRGYIAVAGDRALFDDWFATDAVVAGLLALRFDGPVTVVCGAGPAAPAANKANDGTVAIRVDLHAAVVALTAALGRPVISTSLNLGGEAPAADPWNLPRPLREALTGVYCGDPAPTGQASTIVLWRPPKLACLRRGAVDPALIEAAVRPLRGPA